MAHTGPFRCDCGRVHADAFDGPSNDLLGQIDLDGVCALNEAERGACRRVFKPYEQRLSRDAFVDSEADDPQLIVHIPFISPVRIRGITILGGPEGSAPCRLLAYVNQEALDFSDAEAMPPVQEWTLADATAGEVEYPTQFSRFQNVSRLSLFVADNHGADHTRIYYIGLSGVSSNYKREAVQAVYELQANPEMSASPSDVVGSHII
ncbi:hypothetical protein AB1Y20_004683 [Prymnesium parvum]|uniref:PITH domain-containing protein n=1 Tax=Prymnesium parvum TaxID=97485 RepID=A0AB34IXC9_PRYPA